MSDRTEKAQKFRIIMFWKVFYFCLDMKIKPLINR